MSRGTVGTTDLADGEVVVIGGAGRYGLDDRFAPIGANALQALDLDPDAIFVQQQNLWTSAGVTTGIDLALAMVEADYGHEVAHRSPVDLPASPRSRAGTGRRRS